MRDELESIVVRHTLRLPAPAGPAGESAAAARQLDAALLSVGFKLSAEAMRHLSGLSRQTVLDTAGRTLATVRAMVGDHVRHNVYFLDFPANVPDTCEFWADRIADALGRPESRELVSAQLATGILDLLSLPGYGRYRHPYERMLAAHPELLAGSDDRLTVLHLGGPLEDEVTALYLALAGSTTPLGDEGLRDLSALAGHCVHGPQPEAIPVRETRAYVNLARLAAGTDLLLDTVTDVLRLACVLCDGDVTLGEATRFSSFSRPVRRALLAGLDAVVAAAPAKLVDVHAHREAFKRLGERLHPHEYPKWPHAGQVFAVARGEQEARSLESRVEELLGAGGTVDAARQLATAPGKLFRALDRLLRESATDAERDAVLAAAGQVADRVSGRVLLSVREHFANRGRETGRRRVFVNRLGRAHVAGDTRPAVADSASARMLDLLDTELRRRLPAPGHLLVDPAVLDVALPLSGRATAAGFGVLPRGSLSAVEGGELLRFFVYWKEAARTTDFDLSALLLDADYGTVSWLSFTALKEVEGEHSGDITEAPDGASEFINLRLGAVRGDYIVPQVNIYSGEGFDQVEESFFGYMLRDAEQLGRPFEPRTVRMKSDLRGPGRVALPMVFLRDNDGRWYAKWLHLYLKGSPAANQVEDNRASVATLVRGIVERDFLTVRYLTELLTPAAEAVTTWDGTTLPPGPVTFIGLERPEGLHPDSRVITPENLRDLIPA